MNKTIPAFLPRSGFSPCTRQITIVMLAFGLALILAIRYFEECVGEKMP